jgi:toluene monooxygenase electron transfer component
MPGRLVVTTRRIRIEPDGIEVEASEGETILQASRRAGVVLPYECGWGSCGACKVTLLEGRVELIFPGAPAVSPRDARRGRILTCQSRAVIDLRIARSPGDWPGTAMPCAEKTATLVAVEDLGSEIRQFTFETAAKVGFLPGQYAILHLGEGLRRCYSMCNLPGEKTLQFIAKRYENGPGSNALAALRVGESITIEAPFGVSTLGRSPGCKVLVAGGTGIAPILAMVRQAARERLDFDAPVHIIYGARSPADLVAADMLELATSRLPHARYLPVVEEAPSGWPHAKGFVTDAIAATIADPGTAEFYVAGPPAMVGAVKTLLQRIGVPITQVHYDSFG